MGYTWPPNIRDSDEENAAKFYKWPADEKIGERLITDYEPDN